jgi:hypothetical protein
MKGFPQRKIYQVAAAHEVGHWLHDPSEAYLEHIDHAHAATLPEAERDDAEYGRTLGRRVATMGSGNLCTDHEAKPWLGRIGQHVSTLAGWTFMHRIHFRQRFP